MFYQSIGIIEECHILVRQHFLLIYLTLQFKKLFLERETERLKEREKERETFPSLVLSADAHSSTT